MNFEDVKMKLHCQFFVASLSLAHEVVLTDGLEDWNAIADWTVVKKQMDQREKKPLLFRFSGRVKDDKYFSQIILGG